jgi:hypothetical protein
MKPQSPLPWWEQYLGLKIRWPQLLRPKRVWKITGGYLAWIVPGALLSLLTSLFGLQPKQVPVQVRPKEVHIASQSLDSTLTLEDSADLGAGGASANVSVPLTGEMSFTGQGVLLTGHTLTIPPLPSDDNDKA